MPKKKQVITGKLDDQDATILTGIQTAVDLLYRKHAAEIRRNIEESGQEKGNVAFTVSIDRTEAAPSLKVAIRYSRTYSDNLVSILPEAGQVEFDFMSADDAKSVIQDGDGGE